MIGSSVVKEFSVKQIRKFFGRGESNFKDASFIEHIRWTLLMQEYPVFLVFYAASIHQKIIRNIVTFF